MSIIFTYLKINLSSYVEILVLSHFLRLPWGTVLKAFQLNPPAFGTDETRDINYWRGGIWRSLGLEKVKIQVERNMQMMAKCDGHWMWNYITRRAALPSTVPFSGWQNQLFHLSHPRKKKKKRSNDFNERLFNLPLSDEWTSVGHTHRPAAFTAV